MPQRSNAFQQLVLLLHEQLDEGSVVSESAMLKDSRTGELREVDVIIAAEIAGYDIQIGVECVDTTRRAPVTWVEQVWAKHLDLPTNKLILVSRAGFSPRALKKAKALGIVAISLDEAREADWAQIVGRLAAVFVDFVESELEVKAIVVGDDGVHQEALIGRKVNIANADGTASVTVGSLVDQIVALPEVGRVLLEYMHREGVEDNTFTADYSFPHPVYAVDTHGVKRHVASLRIVLNAKRGQTEVGLTHGSIQGAGVAYGEGVGAGGRLRVAVVERKGRPLAVKVLKQTGSVWKPLVFIYDT